MTVTISGIIHFHWGSSIRGTGLEEAILISYPGYMTVSKATRRQRGSQRVKERDSPGSSNINVSRLLVLKAGMHVGVSILTGQEKILRSFAGSTMHTG